MIAAAPDAPAVQPPPAGDHQAVRLRRNIGAEPAQLAGQDRHAVGLLQPQLGRVANHRLPRGQTGGHRQHRQLIDGAGNDGAADQDPAQGAGAHGHRPHGLSPFFAFVPHLHARAHHAQDIQYPGACRVDADVRHRHLGTGHERAGDEEVRGRGEVSRHAHRGAARRRRAG